MSGRVPPSSRARSRIPAVTELQRAARRYTRFTGHEAEDFGKLDIPPLPKVAACIGEVDGIMYTTVRDGRVEKYVHEFKGEAKPLLCVTPDGRQILLVGGSYTFTERGIVDKRKKSG
jgi:hypothetical protein